MSPTAYTQGYQPIASNDFSGGLNLRDKSDAVGAKEAIDLLNVTFTDRGAVRTRDGLADLTASDLSGRVNSMSPFNTVAGLRQLVAALDNGDLVALDSAGNTVTSIGSLSGAPCTFQRFGTPLTEYLYVANGIDTIRRYDGASWADGSVIATVNGVAGQPMPRAGAICVTAQAPGATSASNANNRLVATAFGTAPAAGPGGAATSPSRAYFSNAGDPHTWETDGVTVGPSTRGRNFLDFTPGDGEQILGACSWRELTFIFKESKFFVVWGESTNTDGTPVFNYREVVNQAGLATRHALCAGRDGVYFVNQRGVYVTTGGEPKLLSDIIKPMWTQDPDVYFQSDPINLTALDKARAHWHRERFYFAVPTGLRTVNDRVLSYDVNYNWWTLYDLPASALATFQTGSTGSIEELHLGYSTGKDYPMRVGRLSLGVETDRGLPIESRWRSGWTDDGMTIQHTQREAKLWGTGAVNVCFSVDFELTQRGERTAVLGVGGRWPTGGLWDDWIASLGGRWPGSRQPADDLARFGLRGTVFSTEFESNSLSPVWSVHRLARHLRETREASIL